MEPRVTHSFVRVLAALLAAAMPALWAPGSPAQPAPARPSTESGTEAEAGRELLNSERIERRFGSYGVQVLRTEGTLRISNLYSERDGQRTGRTFAVVAYPDAVDPALAGEHAGIEGGGSIGAVFTRSGWTVTKRHLWFGELESAGTAASLMSVAEGMPLATHVYVLEVSKDDEVFDYATLAEVHHPDYLQLEELRRIYGPSSAARADDALVGRMLEAARDAMR